MAEAITNSKYNEGWTALSAGTDPAGYVHPYALKVLEEIDIMHTGISKSVADISGIEFDLVVTVCDQAAEECPVWLGSGNKVHYGFPDPATATGSDAEILDAFREVRDQIQNQLSELLES
jgi:arsenate reductase